MSVKKKCKKEADRLWNEVVPKLRRLKGFCPLTPEQAQKAYDEAVPVPMSAEEIQKIVDAVIGDES
jgi:hypothetical protein